MVAVDIILLHLHALLREALIAAKQFHYCDPLLGPKFLHCNLFTAGSLRSDDAWIVEPPIRNPHRDEEQCEYWVLQRFSIVSGPNDLIESRHDVTSCREPSHSIQREKRSPVYCVWQCPYLNRNSLLRVPSEKTSIAAPSTESTVQSTHLQQSSLARHLQKSISCSTAKTPARPDAKDRTRHAQHLGRPERRLSRPGEKSVGC